MKSANKIFALTLSALILLSLLVLIFFYINNNSENYLEIIILVQLIIASVVSLCVMVYCLYPYFRSMRIPENCVTKLAVLSETNAWQNEFYLEKKTSTLICLSDMVYLSHLEGKTKDEEYASLNRVGDIWYLERLSDERNVGMKRFGEQYVYKLKTNIVYKLRINDIIYIENDRLLVV